MSTHADETDEAASLLQPVAIVWHVSFSSTPNEGALYFSEGDCLFGAQPTWRSDRSRTEEAGFHVCGALISRDPIHEVTW